MEQGRLLIAIGLSFMVFLFWQFFIAEPKPTPQPQNTAADTAIEKETPKATEGELSKNSMPLKQGFTQNKTAHAVASRVISVNTPLYKVQIDTAGAVFTKFVLKKYRQSIEPDSPMFEIIEANNRSETLRLELEGNTIPELNQAIFSTDVTTDKIEVPSDGRSISFSWRSPQGIIFEKQYTFHSDTYLIDVTIGLKNGSEMPFRDSVVLKLDKHFSGKSTRYGFMGPSTFVNGKLEEIQIKKIQDHATTTGSIEWVALQDRYFLSAIVHGTKEQATMKLSLSDKEILTLRYVSPSTTVAAQNSYQAKYQAYFGPKSISILKSAGSNLDKAINFGWFDFIAKPCVWFMNFIYRYIPNYGVVIIILTLLIKIMLFPLGNKSYRSMNKMKKIQPLVAEIKTKYKHDKKKMNEETMAMYKLYKVNPMGGCLPMIVQLPVFFALYRMLYGAIELRHAPFIGWINDLSAPDRLLHFSFALPFMDPPYGIPVLTIIMGASMFLQQRMTPTMGDPMQAKMMMFMPVIFTFIFINFSSGLVLYWLVNNIFSMAQQYYVGRTGK